MGWDAFVKENHAKVKTFPLTYYFPHYFMRGSGVGVLSGSSFHLRLVALT